jgi:hypothetical protein
MNPLFSLLAKKNYFKLLKISSGLSWVANGRWLIYYIYFSANFRVNAARPFSEQGLPVWTLFSNMADVLVVDSLKIFTRTQKKREKSPGWRGLPSDCLFFFHVCLHFGFIWKLSSQVRKEDSAATCQGRLFNLIDQTTKSTITKKDFWGTWEGEQCERTEQSSSGAIQMRMSSQLYVALKTTTFSIIIDALYWQWMKDERTVTIKKH